MNFLLSLTPIIVVVSFFCFIWNNKKEDSKTRTSIAIFCALIGLNYIVWRFTSTVWSEQQYSLAENVWTYLVWFIELLGFVEILVFLLIMSRYKKRSEDADKFDYTNWNPSVDIFIPTFNEPIDVLEKTIIGAKNVDWDNKKVYVLDDGKRDWLKEFCEKHNVVYLTRADNKHAKAGNINNGIKNSHGDFVCIFDADFVPFQNFIKRTVGFFQDEKIGIVQTPQHFYNKDPVQMNLYIANQFPDEQRLFFDEMAPSRDAWNAAFCCGSCSIMRREAVNKIGGIPTDSITEDLLTTLDMLQQGYQTIYLNEKLSVGLAAESIKGYFVQRERWGRGAIQTLYLKNGPLNENLSFIQKVLFFPTSWILQYPTRLLMLFIPIMYLWFGFLPLHFNSIEELLFYQVPVLIAYFLAMRWLVRGKYLPLVSISIGVFTSFRMLPAILGSIIKPFGVPFKVTPKGSSSIEGRGTDTFTFGSILLFTLLTLGGIFVNSVPEYSNIRYDNFFPVAVFWALLNIVILLIAGLMCFEMPRKRMEERYQVDQETVITVGNDKFTAIISDFSVSGCKIKVTEHIDIGVPISVNLKALGDLRLKPISYRNGFLMASFLYDTEEQRNAMIAHIFSGQYDNAVHEATDLKTIIKNLLHRALN